MNNQEIVHRMTNPIVTIANRAKARINTCLTSLLRSSHMEILPIN